MKRLIKLIIFGFISTFFFSANVFASDILYEEKPTITDDYKMISKVISKDSSGKIKYIEYGYNNGRIGGYVTYQDANRTIYSVKYEKISKNFTYYYDTSGVLTDSSVSDGNYQLVSGQQTLSFGSYIYESYNLPIFKDAASAQYYVTNGKVQNASDVVSVPEGYKLNENGEFEQAPVLEEMGVPLEFRYYIPDTYKKGVINGNSLQDDFQASWSNKDDKLGYTVQIEYKGKYTYKENFLAPKQEVVSDYHLVGSVFMDLKQWTEHQSNIDYMDGSPVYEDIKAKTGLHNVFLGTAYSLERQGGWMRIRYVKYSGRRIVSYGRWVEHQMTSDGSLTYTTDEQGNKVTSDEYGDGVDYSGLKSNQELDAEKGVVGNTRDTLSQVKNISTTIGQVPPMLSHLLSFMPGEIFMVLGMGVSLIVFIGILKALL